MIRYAVELDLQLRPEEDYAAHLRRARSELAAVPRGVPLRIIVDAAGVANAELLRDSIPAASAVQVTATSAQALRQWQNALGAA